MMSFEALTVRYLQSAVNQASESGEAVRCMDRCVCLIFGKFRSDIPARRNTIDRCWIYFRFRANQSDIIAITICRWHNRWVDVRLLYRGKLWHKSDQTPW